MFEFDPTQVDPLQQSAADLTFPEPLDLSFEGFQPEAFAILDRLREHPHIEQYRQDKPGIKQYLKEPFKRYRDDLVVNWVLPNRLDLETERNVFSRLLKNDFGAGGCHHHYWMAFYRPERRRLTDAQLSHSISPEGFTVGLFVGDYAEDLFERATQRIQAEPERFLALVNPLLASTYYCGWKDRSERTNETDPLETVPDDLLHGTGLWLRTRFPRDDVLAWKGDLVRHALEAVHDVWPVYRFLVADR